MLYSPDRCGLCGDCAAACPQGAIERTGEREPEKHRDLIVRVAGHSDYFRDLTEAPRGRLLRGRSRRGFRFVGGKSWSFGR